MTGWRSDLTTLKSVGLQKQIDKYTWYYKRDIAIVICEKWKELDIKKEGIHKMQEVKSVAEYINYLDTLQETYPKQRYVASSTFFRGQSNIDWKLSPKLYREELLEQEGIMIEEIVHSNPKEFELERFDILAKLQHFGFPTRLLDVTSNPLVALYFACSDKEELAQDGAVYVFPNLPASWSDDPLVDLIMDFIFEHTPNGLHLNNFLKVTQNKYKNVTTRLMPETIKDLLHYLTIPAFAVVPKKNNIRLIAQEGAFFLFGMKILGQKISSNLGTSGRECYSFGQIEMEDHKKLWHASEKVVIPTESKKKILKQLDLMGINEQRLFPDIEHQLKYYWEKYNSKSESKINE